MGPCPVQGPPLEPGLDGGPNSEHLVVGSATETWPGTTGRSRLVPNSPSPHHQVSCHTGGGAIGEPQRPTSGQHRLTLGLWNITKLKGKDSDLAREIERYQLHVVWLNCGSIKRKFSSTVDSHTCIPTAGRLPQHHDQSTHHRRQCPIVQTYEAPPDLPWGSLLPRALLAHLKNRSAVNPKVVVQL